MFPKINLPTPSKRLSLQSQLTYQEQASEILIVNYSSLWNSFSKICVSYRCPPLPSQRSPEADDRTIVMCAGPVSHRLENVTLVSDCSIYFSKVENPT